MLFNKKTYKICVILFLVIVFNLLINTNTIETFDNNVNLFLLGDSVFNNTNYVDKGHSIKDIMNKQYNNVTIVAQDNAVINDLKKQYRLIPDSKKESNSKIIVSVGGNDLLNHYMMSDVSKTNHVNTIFNRYTSNLNNLRNNSDCEFILSNIYYPRSPSYERFYDIIEIWNDKLNKYAKNNGLKILNIDDKVDKKHYFTHDIEPSASGSSVIIDNILNL